tara:strand:- start:13 stop:750 length:738 start_codon:yes stop_codon:yes gene_type:complete
MSSPFQKKFSSNSPIKQRLTTDPVSNEQLIQNYYKARLATGRFDDQLGDGQIEAGLENIKKTRRVTKSEFEDMGYETDGGSGGYGPQDQTSWVEPTIFQRLTGTTAKSTDLHEKVHQFEVGTTGKTGSSKPDDVKRYGNSNIVQAIKNIPGRSFEGKPTAIGEYMDPQEVAAELVRFKIENGIDPAKIYNKEDLPELRSKLQKEKEYGMFNINQSYDDDGLLRLFNEVAANDNKQLPFTSKNRVV